MGAPVRIALISGTRPEIIKLAPVYHELRGQEWAEVEWIHTGQHVEMADQILDCFEIQPKTRLQRMGTRIEEFSGSCRQQLDDVLRAGRYDFCLVQGDTESAYVGGVTAFYRRIPLGHVEAGLRTYNLSRPFPEEAIRQMISRIADIHFAPTDRACSALLREGIPPERIVLTGNTVVDAQCWAAKSKGIGRRREGKGHILVTVHRREHWGAEMEEIFRAVARIARDRPQQQVLFPVHLNPIVRDAAHGLLSDIGNVQLREPLDYVAMQQAIADAAIVLTDSGGLQEEAPTYKVPVLVLRHETERPEAVDAGFATVVGPDCAAIVARTHAILGDTEYLLGLQNRPNPYGDGHAARRIALTIRAHFSANPESPVVPAAEPRVQPVRADVVSGLGLAI